MENSTATSTLAAGISTLASCVRPMLLSGWPQGPDVEETGPQVGGPYREGGYLTDIDCHQLILRTTDDAYHVEDLFDIRVFSSNR